MKHFISILLITSLFYFAFGQSIAISNDGTIVQLNDDGTWSKQIEVKIANSIFRNTKWGMSIEDVKKVEKLTISFENNDSLFVETSINGLICDSIYIFADNKLVRGRYFFKENHSNLNNYINDYMSIQELLTMKYGKPIDENQIWRDDLYKEDSDNWGMAIASGRMFFYSDWETEDTIIHQEIWGDNYEIKHTIDYTSKKLGDLEDLIRNKKAMDKL